MRLKQIVNVTGVPTHHYFVIDTKTFMPIMKDIYSNILIYTNRDQAEKATIIRYGSKVNMYIVGMGDEKWELFQRTEKYVIVK